MSQGGDSLNFENQLTHKISDTHEDILWATKTGQI